MNESEDRDSELQALFAADDANVGDGAFRAAVMARIESRERLRRRVAIGGAAAAMLVIAVVGPVQLAALVNSALGTPMIELTGLAGIALSPLSSAYGVVGAAVLFLLALMRRVLS